MPICHDKKIIFIHIPKTAGTYVERYLNMNNTKDATWIFYKENYPEEWKSYKKFSIVRNPISRFVSLCNFCLMERSEMDSNIPFWELNNSKIPKNVHKVDFNFIEVENKILLSNNDIKKILKEKTINEFVDLLYTNDYQIPFYPWWPQTFNICDKNDNIMVDEIIYYEDLQSNFLNIDFKKYKKINESFYNDKTKLNKRSVARLFQIYKTDFQIFNYKNPVSFLKYY